MVCDRSVLALNGRDGSVLWRTNEQDQSIRQQPVVAEDGTVIVTGYGETGTPWSHDIVFALRGGQEVWRVDMPPASLWRLGGVTTSDGVTYIQRFLSPGPFTYTAVDAVSSNGTTLWTFDPSKSFVV